MHLTIRANQHRELALVSTGRHWPGVAALGDNRREEGDCIRIKRLPKNSYVDETYEVLGFQQIGSSWFLNRYKQGERTFLVRFAVSATAIH